MPRTENQKAVTAYLPHQLYEQLSEFKFNEDLRSDSQAIAVILERFFFAPTPSHQSTDTSVEDRLRGLEEQFNRLSDEFDQLRLANFVSTLQSTFKSSVPSTLESTVDDNVPSTLESTVDDNVPSTLESTVDDNVPSTLESTVDDNVPSTLESTVDDNVPSTLESTVDDDVLNYHWMSFEEAWATLPTPKPKDWDDGEQGMLKTRAKRQLREARTGSEHWANFAAKLFKTIGFELNVNRGDHCLRKLPEPIPHVWNLYEPDGTLAAGGFNKKLDAQNYCRDYEDKEKVRRWRWEYEPANLAVN